MSIVTISRGTFSGGQSLAECVAEKLGYRCIAREVLAQAASDYGVDEEKMHRSLEEKPGFLDRKGLERIHYTAYIRSALAREVQGDNVVYHGHAGHLLLKGVPHVLKVRVIANMEQRILSAMYRQGLSREEAIDYIDGVDAGRAKWTRYLYGVDWADPALYDLVVNLDQLSVSSGCDVVQAAAGLEEYRTTPESQKVLDDLVIACDARARIAAEKSIGDADVDVEVREGAAMITGVIGSLEEADRVKLIVRDTPGVVDIISRIRVRTHW